MGTPEISETVTEGVRITATAFFLPQESAADEGRYVFGYRITIVNDSPLAITLMARHWIIIDAEGRREDVQGPGVVGQTPTLAPGQGFKYTSYCPLGSQWGTMEGAYQMRRENGESFAAHIGRFYLTMLREAPERTTA